MENQVRNTDKVTLAWHMVVCLPMVTGSSRASSSMPWVSPPRNAVVAIIETNSPTQQSPLQQPARAEIPVPGDHTVGWLNNDKNQLLH